MQQPALPPTITDRHVAAVVARIFPGPPPQIARVPEGVSTYVYRLTLPKAIFYLRILPEVDASFAPEVAVHRQLRQSGVTIPDVIHFEPRNELLERSVMVTSAIAGRPISQSGDLSRETQEKVIRQAGQDLARINSVPVAGFGWVRREPETRPLLQAEYATYRAFILANWEEDLAYLSGHVLLTAEASRLEHIRRRHDSWLDAPEGLLAHGDFDTTQIYQDTGRYTGIIDFGEIRGAGCWYDLAHFHVRDGEQLPSALLAALVRGYQDIVSLPADYMAHLRFTSLWLNIYLLARSLRKRPLNRYTRHQIAVLQADLAAFD